MDKLARWGDLESEEEESEDEEEEEEEEEDDTESLADGIASIASGYNSSLPSGIETPEVIDLRKGKAGARPAPTLGSRDACILVCSHRPCHAVDCVVVPGKLPAQLGIDNLAVAELHGWACMDPQTGMCRGKLGSVCGR